MTINLIVLTLLVVAALWTVLTLTLLRAAIGLALTSVILTILMFRLDSPLAAVFELSVCAGLIPVIFISTINLTHPMTKQQDLQHMKIRMSRFWFLPVFVLLLGLILALTAVKLNLALPAQETVKDVQTVLWNTRQFDIIGQILVLLTGIFGVAILFKEIRKK